MKVKGTYFQNSADQPLVYGEVETINPPRRKLRGLEETVNDYIALEAGTEAAEVSAPVLYLPSPGETLRGVCLRIYGNLDRLDELKTLNEIEDEDAVLSEQWLKLP